MGFKETGGVLLSFPQPRYPIRTEQRKAEDGSRDTDMLSTTSLLQAAELMWEQDFASPQSNTHSLYDNNPARYDPRPQHQVVPPMSISMPVTRAPSPVHENPSYASTTVSPHGSRPLTPQAEGSFSFRTSQKSASVNQEQGMAFPKTSSSKPPTPKRPASMYGFSTKDETAWGSASFKQTKGTRAPPATKVTPKPGFLERRHSNANGHGEAAAAGAAGNVKSKRRRASVADTRNEDRLESKKVFSVYDEARHHRILNLMRKGTVPKCRAVYGMTEKHTWCRQCRYKKACTRSEFFHRDMLHLVERESIAFPMTPVCTPVALSSPASTSEGYPLPADKKRPFLQSSFAGITLLSLIEAKLIFPGDTLHCKGQTALLSREGLVLSPEGNFACPQQWCLQVTRQKGESFENVDGWSVATLRNGYNLDQVRCQYLDMMAASKTQQQPPTPSAEQGPLTPSESEEGSPVRS